MGHGRHLLGSSEKRISPSSWMASLGDREATGPHQGPWQPPLGSQAAHTIGCQLLLGAGCNDKHTRQKLGPTSERAVQRGRQTPTTARVMV